jgi:hypothetical protein
MERKKQKKKTAHQTTTMKQIKTSYLDSTHQTKQHTSGEKKKKSTTTNDGMGGPSPALKNTHMACKADKVDS